MRKAMPILVIFALNFFLLLIGAPALYLANINLYRILAPALGRFPANLAQAAVSAAAIVSWLYLWRRAYYRLFKQRLARLSAK